MSSASGELISGSSRRSRPSRVQESVLDEDTYTDTLSHIIGRDFFPQLPHLHATNAYLTALQSRDPEQLSVAIRRLAALSREQDARSGINAGATPSSSRPDATSETLQTPSTQRHRTPLGARYFDTPDVRYRSQSPDEGEQTAGPSRPAKKAKVRANDLSLNDFQRVFTSEDNASFADIMDEENEQNRGKWSWAWKAEEKAKQSRLRLEARRERLLIEAKGVPSASLNVKTIRAADSAGDGPDFAIEHPEASSSALVTTDFAAQNGRTVILRSEVFAADPSTEPIVLPTSPLCETPLGPDDPLTLALQAAGLPPTALTDNEGMIVPHREMASGAGDDRGRGDKERQRRREVESSVMDVAGQKDLRPNDYGAGSQGWGYKARNALMYPPDADAPSNNSLGFSYNMDPAATRQDPPRVVYANTAIDDGGMKHRSSGSVASSSPTRSVVAAAVGGANNGPAFPSVGSYPLLPIDASPSPAELPDLLTWGTLMSTPRALGVSGDAPSNGRTFRLPDNQRRDQLAHKLADDASRSMRMRAKGFAKPATVAVPKRSSVTSKKTSMLPPATPRPNATSLTPAARKLLERSSRTPAPLVRKTGDSLDGVSSRTSLNNRGWTPSPAHR